VAFVCELFLDIELILIYPVYFYIHLFLIIIIDHHIPSLCFLFLCHPNSNRWDRSYLCLSCRCGKSVDTLCSQARLCCVFWCLKNSDSAVNHSFSIGSFVRSFSFLPLFFILIFGVPLSFHFLNPNVINREHVIVRVPAVLFPIGFLFLFLAFLRILHIQAVNFPAECLFVKITFTKFQTAQLNLTFG